MTEGLTDTIKYMSAARTQLNGHELRIINIFGVSHFEKNDFDRSDGYLLKDYKDLDY